MERVYLKQENGGAASHASNRVTYDTQQKKRTDLRLWFKRSKEHNKDLNNSLNLYSGGCHYYIRVMRSTD